MLKVMTPSFFDEVARGRDGLSRVINSGVPDKDAETAAQKAAILQMFDAAEWPTLSFVDCGCGVGRLTPWLAKVGRQAVGLDWSDEMLRAASLGEAAPELEYRKANIGAFPSDAIKGQMDVAFTWCVMIHLTDDAAWRNACANMRAWARESVLYCDKVNDNATVDYVKVRDVGTIMGQFDEAHGFRLARAHKFVGYPEDEFALLRFDRIDREE